MRRSDFRDLQIWQKSRVIVRDLYRITKTYPSDERFEIVSQIRRAGISVMSNIAEGHGRSSNQDFCRFLFMSLGPVRELESLIEISQDLGFLEDGSELISNLQEEARMITAFIAHLKSQD